MTTVTTSAPKAKTFYGISAKDMLVLVQAEQNPTRLGEMLAFAQKRIADHKAKHPSRVKRWERVSDALVARLRGGPSVPALANAATFTTIQPKAVKRKPASKPKALSIDALLAQTGLSPEDLMLQLAARMKA